MSVKSPITNFITPCFTIDITRLAMLTINHECTFRWLAILPDVRSLFLPKQQTGVMLISMAGRAFVSLAVYDLKIFTFLY